VETNSVKNTSGLPYLAITRRKAASVTSYSGASASLVCIVCEQLNERQYMFADDDNTSVSDWAGDKIDDAKEVAGDAKEALAEDWQETKKDAGELSENRMLGHDGDNDK
jgi:hypothetical protein